MTIDDKRIKEVAFKLNVSEEEVISCVNLLYVKAKQEMESFDLDKKNLLSKEEFKLVSKIIKIPHIGFLVPKYQAYLNVTKSYIAKQERINNNKQ